MNCHCGLPLHYSNPKTQAYVQRLIDKAGEFVTVTVCGRSWRVQRHYIALHGLKAQDLLNGVTGFEEVTLK